MTLGKRLAVVGFVAAAVLLATGTGGFSTMAADRGVEVAVVNDSEASVGYESSCAGGDLSVTVTNRFGREVDEGAVTVAGTTEQVGSLDSGAASTVVFEPDEFEPGDSVAVEVSSSDLSATVDRSVPAGCVPAVPDIEGVRFTGAAAGNARIQLSHGGNGALEVRYWRLSDGELEPGTVTITDPQGTVGMQQRAPGSSSGFAAVYIPETDTTYAHRNLEYDDANGEWSITGGSGSNTVTDRVCAGELDFTDPAAACACWDGS